MSVTSLLGPESAAAVDQLALNILDSLDMFLDDTLGADLRFG